MTQLGRQEARVLAHSKPGMRVDIQVLRAFAVGVVLLYHFWPNRLPGGFIGVDVFFVISGFLISGQLMRTAVDGRVELMSFWARRAKRLLPAALAVVIAVAAATLTLLDRTYWDQVFRELIGASVYVENWVLARDAVDYLAAENIASPVQHYWSLSVEEQFYVVWPLLFSAACLVFAGRPRRRSTAISIAITILAAASFVYCLVETAANPGLAYFSTFTRGWEFAAGALAAVLVRRWSPTGSTRIALGSAGGLALIVSVFVLSGATPFPGAAALLPVLGATALLIAHFDGKPNSLLARGLVSAAAAIGDRSYSLYLWHWPIITIAQLRASGELSWPWKLGLVVLAFILAELSYRWVENPVRRIRVAQGRRATAFVVAAVVAAIAVALPLQAGRASIQSSNAAELESAQAEAADAALTPKACFGAAALAPGSACDTTGIDLVPAPDAAVDDLPDIYDKGCVVDINEAAPKRCTFGAGETRVALVGDSHGATWTPALEAIAKQRGWTVDTYLKSACTYSLARSYLGSEDQQQSCESWKAKVTSQLARDRPYDLVFVAGSATAEKYESNEIGVAGFREAWAPLEDRGSKVVVLRDVPRAPDDAASCLVQNDGEARSCSLQKDAAFPRPDLLEQAAESGDATVMDFTRYLCTAEACPTAIGGVTVYRDSHHLTATFVRTLTPYFAQMLDRLHL